MDHIRPTRAKAYLDQLKSSGDAVQFLRGLINSPTPTFESEFLEFKGGYQLDLKGSDLTELWAKCLSCFANSDGGVLIFGINAPKGAAKSLSLVQDVVALRNRLHELVPSITEPPVQRVEIETYLEKEGILAGFVVCHIPSSPWRPHQVRSQGQPGQFYIRATDNCIPCNHATLRALFAPQYVSVLEVSFRTLLRAATGYQNVVMACWLDNNGPATAREVFVHYTHPPNSPLAFDEQLWESTPTAREGKAIICQRPIHPGERVQLFSAPLGSITQDGSRHFREDRFTFRLSISARDQAPTDFELTVFPESVEDQTLKKAILIEAR